MKEIQYWLDHNLKNYKNKKLPITDFQVDHIIDWLKSDDAIRHRKRIARLSIPDAIRLSELWTLKLNKRSTDKETDSDIEVIYLYKNGFKVVKLLTQQAYNREGKLMDHCVASYFGTSSSLIISFRDKDNKPFCTAELDLSLSETIIKQVKGENNQCVPKKYRKYVQKYLIKNYKKALLSLDFSDLAIIGLFKNEESSELVKFSELADKRWEYHCDIDLACLELDEMPNIICYGHLNLAGNKIKVIPHGFQQRGSLGLSGNLLKKIPDGFIQCGMLGLEDNQISKIPGDFQQNGWLSFGNNKIKKIPDGFKQNGDLFLYANQIKSIPKGFVQKGVLYLSHNQIKAIPDGFVQTAELNLNNNKIKKLPKNFIFTHKYNIENNPVQNRMTETKTPEYILDNGFKIIKIDTEFDFVVEKRKIFPQINHEARLMLVERVYSYRDNKNNTLGLIILRKEAELNTILYFYNGKFVINYDDIRTFIVDNDVGIDYQVFEVGTLSENNAQIFWRYSLKDMNIV